MRTFLAKFVRTTGEPPLLFSRVLRGYRKTAPVKTHVGWQPIATATTKSSAIPKQPEQGQAMELPEGGFEHPFQGSVYDVGPRQGKEPPRTIVELRMCALSYHIREKPSWWEKAKDEVIVEKWREEALQQEEELGDVGPSRKLTPTMVNYVLEELHGYASLRGPETGVEVGPAERIWRSDQLIPSLLREKLLAAVTPLEAVPDSEKDWHPGSDGLVLDLVHPSLYPVVYGRTMGKISGSDTATILEPPVLQCADPQFVSGRFQWLPSDFSVDGDGKVTLASPYINNIHPTRHKELYSLIPGILQHALPMFERVLSDLLRPLLPMRIVTSGGRGYGGEETADCIWKDGIPYPDSSSEAEYEEDQDAWYAKREFSTPDARGKYDGDLEVMKDQISLKGRTLQVIVKLANIVLTPEKPEYPGGKWHVEGMRNEMIVSSFIYYYDSENISECRLSFRRATCEPHAHEQDDSMCMRTLYDMDRDSPCVQDIGDVITKTHRCVAFPNLYQHQVQPFHLEDSTKPGHRRILVFFLVDPTQRVFSATEVAPQQHRWVTEAIHGAGQNSAFAKLPVELLTMISNENEGAMTRLEAEKFREELMSERTIFIEENDKEYFGMEFNMCEH